MSVLKSNNAPKIGSRDYDPEIRDIADYVYNYKIESDVAVNHWAKRLAYFD